MNKYINTPNFMGMITVKAMTLSRITNYTDIEVKKIECVGHV